VVSEAGRPFWRGMAENERDALDAAARENGLCSYRYAVALGLIARDAWTVEKTDFRMCQIVGMVDGVERVLMAAPIRDIGDVDRMKDEIPDEIYNTAKPGTVRAVWLF